MLWLKIKIKKGEIHIAHKYSKINLASEMYQSKFIGILKFAKRRGNKLDKSLTPKMCLPEKIKVFQMALMYFSNFFISMTSRQNITKEKKLKSFEAQRNLKRKKCFIPCRNKKQNRILLQKMESLSLFYCFFDSFPV